MVDGVVLYHFCIFIGKKIKENGPGSKNQLKTMGERWQHGRKMKCMCHPVHSHID